MRARIPEILSILLLATAGPPAGAGIAGSKHDLSSSGGGEIKSDISFSCYFCHSVHTPEEGAGGGGGLPMWNKNLSTLGPYAVYSSSSLDTFPSSAPAGASLACLSCHDGTVAVNVIRSGVLGTMTPTDRLAGRTSDLTTDLANDHPVSLTYSNAADAGLRTLAEVLGAGVKLYGPGEDQVECGSCHDAHNPTHPPFLRKANTRSQLCLSCHAK